MRKISGVGASEGIRIGPSFVHHGLELKVHKEPKDDPEMEWRRLQRALQESEAQLGEVFDRIKSAADDKYAEIFKAHRSMVKDPELLSRVRELIDSRQFGAEGAMDEAAEEYAERLEGAKSETIRARAADVRDVKNRVLANLQGVEGAGLADLKRPSIILAEDLTPSDTARMAESLVLGFCLAGGTRNSHAAILARGMNIPAVVAAGEEILDIRDGVDLILDGGAGHLIVDPDHETVEEYDGRRDRLRTLVEAARERAHDEAVTGDGVRVEVAANLGDVKDAQAARDAGAEGVGLLRTEFLFLGRSNLPQEEEQYQAYRAILEIFDGRPVILRTLDLGGDKNPPYLEIPEGRNPFLGLRGIRYALHRTDLLRTQLRAALRAGAGYPLKIMFPMIATPDELRQAKAILEACQEELEGEGETAVEDLETGIMIEVPSAALTVDQLSPLVDFFSIGSNDLSQYVMAADRTNKEVASLASGLHPPLLRLIRRVIKDAHDHDRWVGLCGEMAGDPVAIPILLGMGLDEFSMVPSRIPQAKQLIRSLSASEMEVIAREVLDMDGADQVKAYIHSEVLGAMDLF